MMYHRKIIQSFIVVVGFFWGVDARFTGSAFVTSKRAPSVGAADLRRVVGRVGSASSALSLATDDLSDTGFVLLAGGTGSRMKADRPKQFLELAGTTVLSHSLKLFLETLPNTLSEGPPMVVLVMNKQWRSDFEDWVNKYDGRLIFADPGEERQGSVENGLKALSENTGPGCKYVAVHDSARPLVTIEEICNVVADAREFGASVLGVPCKATIKESDDGILVQRTIPRARLWEVHTPQVILIETLLEGFAKVEAENLEVTDDVSIVEALGKAVKLTKGEYTNLKITTPEDMDVAEAILADRAKSK